jgi:hypothetical protein
VKESSNGGLLGINEVLQSRADVREDFLVRLWLHSRTVDVSFSGRTTPHLIKLQMVVLRLRPHRWKVRAIFNPVKPILTVLYAGS